MIGMGDPLYSDRRQPHPTPTGEPQMGKTYSKKPGNMPTPKPIKKPGKSKK